MKTSKIAISRGHNVRMAAWLLMLLTGAGCASDTSYDRHSLSRLWLSQDGSQLFFDATVSATYPADSGDAEAVRLGWLSDWLRLRNFCDGGHRIRERRAIEGDEYNPHRYHLRYRVECL